MGTRLHSGQVRRPPRPGAYGERSGPVLRGVARLLAVADLTVKTNIRTARRGTLRGARTSSTMQADHRACFARKILSGGRTYVSNAKLDKNAGNTSPPTVRIQFKMHECVQFRRSPTIHRFFGKGQITVAWVEERHQRLFSRQLHLSSRRKEPRSIDRLFWR